MRIESFRRTCVAIVSLSLLSLGLQAPAAASVVGTSEAIAADQNDGARAVVDATLARADVREKLAEMGVDAAAIEGRLIAALSEQEVAALTDRGAPAWWRRARRDRRRVRGPSHPRARRRDRHLQEDVIRGAPVIAALAVALTGCAASPPLAEGLPAAAPPRVELASTPFFPQEEYQCGPCRACRALLVASGIAVTPDNARAGSVHSRAAREPAARIDRRRAPPWAAALCAREDGRRNDRRARVRPAGAGTAEPRRDAAANLALRRAHRLRRRAQCRAAPVRRRRTN